MEEVPNIDVFREELIAVARQFTGSAASVENASDLIVWFTFALLDRNRSAWTDEQRRAIIHKCIKEMQLRIEHGSWSEEWLGWKSS